jgi:hypothetical protein
MVVAVAPSVTLEGDIEVIAGTGFCGGGGGVDDPPPAQPKRSNAETAITSEVNKHLTSLRRGAG